MSNFNLTDLHNGLPYEAQHEVDLNDSVVKQESMFDDAGLLNDQLSVGRQPELFDHGVQQGYFSDTFVPLSDETPLERFPKLLGNRDQQDSMYDPSIPIDVHSLVEQPSELYFDCSVKQESMLSDTMVVDDQPPVGRRPELYDYGTLDYIIFNGGDFERDIARINEDAQGWWVQRGGSLDDNGLIDFSSSTDRPHFDFEMSGTSPPHDSTAPASDAELMNSFGLGGDPSIVDTTTTDGPQQVFVRPDSSPSPYPCPPATVSHPLPYNFNLEDIAQRQYRVMAGNGPGRFMTNSGTGTRLEAIPENEARSPRLSSSPPKPLSTVDTRDSSAQTLTTPSPSPVLQKGSANEQPSERRPSVATGRNQSTIKFPIHKSFLLVNGLAEAKDLANTRIALDVIDDDREAVLSRPEHWIPLIAQAFESDYLEQPDDGTRLTAEGQKEWTRWQREHSKKVWSILTSYPESEAPRFVQSCAYIFYDLVLEAHEIGKGLPRVGKTVANPGPNVTLKCSERINAAIDMLKKFPIVRYDLLRQDRLDGLAANPIGFVHRKLDNMWVNFRKKPNSGPVKEVMKPEPTASDGTDFSIGKTKGKKRKASETEQQLDANGLLTGAADTTTQPRRKRVKAASKKRGSQVLVPTSEIVTPVKAKDEDKIM